MKHALIFAALVLVSSTAFADTKQPVDADCQRMASNAKAFSTLKATGVASTPEQFQSFVVTPVVQSYPIRAIVQYVFAAKDQTPDQVYQALYGRCVLMGYQELFSYFQDREATAKVQVLLDKANADIASLQVDNQKLVQQNVSLRQEIASPQARRHVAVSPNK